MDLLKLLETQLQKQAVGTLTLGRQNNFRELFMQGSSVYLIGDQFTGKVAVERLHETKIIGTKISRQGLEQLILRANLKKRLLPVLLHEQGLLTDEQLKSVAQEHLLEEIIIQIAKYSGTFLFQEGRVPEYVLKGEDITTRVPIDLQNVLDELRQRGRALEEIKTALPSRDEIFVLTERGIALKEQSKDSLLVHQLYGLTDGLRSLRAIIDDSYLFEHHILRFLVQSLEQGLVKKRDIPELKGIRVQDLGRNEAERLIPILRSAVKYAVDEVPVREQFACALEIAERPEEAVIHYNFLGDSYYRLGDTAKALAAYHRALEIRPTELHVRDKLVAIYREQALGEKAAGNRAKAVDLMVKALLLNPCNSTLFMELAHWHIQEERPQDLSTLCDRMVAAAKDLKLPEVGIQACRYAALSVGESQVFRKKLVNLYLDFGRSSEAVSELQVLAQDYLKADDLGRTREIIDKLRRVEGGGAAAAGIERVVDRRRKKKTTRAAARLVCGLILIVFGYEAWSYYLWKGLIDREVIAESSVPALDAPLLLEKSAEELRWQSILESVDRYRRDFPFSLWSTEAGALAQDLSGRLGMRRTIRDTHVREILEQASSAAAEGEKEVVRSLIAPILAAGPDVPHREDAEALERLARSLKASARELQVEAEERQAEGRWKDVFRLRRQILEQLPRSRAARSLQLPVEIRSTPSGASVLRKGVEAGHTPFVEWLSPGASSELELTLEGFIPMRLVVSEVDAGARVVSLFKRPIWSQELGARPSISPTIFEGNVICGLDSGRLRTFDLLTGAEKWPDWALEGDRLVAPIYATPSSFFALTSSARLRAAATAGKGEAERPRWRAEIVLPSLASGAFLSVEGGQLFLVGTLSGEVHLVAARDLARQGVLSVGAEPWMALEGSSGIYVATRDGGIHRLSLAPFSVVWSRKPASETPTDWMLSASSVVGVTRRNEVLILDQGTGKVTERRTFAQDASLVLLPETKELLMLSAKGATSALDPVSGSALRTGSDAPRGALHALAGGALIVQLDGKTCTLLDGPTLEPLWTAGLPSAIVQVVGTPTEVILTTQAGHLTLLGR